MPEDCIFCKIVNGEIPSTKIYENDDVLAFLDINPVNPGHTLIVSKNHYANIEEIPETELCELIKVVKKIGRALKEGLGIKGYNVHENNDPIAGQDIPHIHFHIIPRENEIMFPEDFIGKYEGDEARECAEKIKSKL